MSVFPGSDIDDHEDVFVGTRKVTGDVSDLSSGQPDGPMFFDDDGDSFEEDDSPAPQELIDLLGFDPDDLED